MHLFQHFNKVSKYRRLFASEHSARIAKSRARYAHARDKSILVFYCFAVTVRVLLVPVPRAGNDFLDIAKLWLPAENFACLVGGRNQRGWVTGAAWGHHGGDFLAGRAPGGFEDLKVGEAGGGTEVKGIAVVARGQLEDN